MKIDKPVLRREVTRIDNPPVLAGHVVGHTLRRLIDGRHTAFTDPFVLLAEDWMPRGAFPPHPHRGMETVTFVIEGAVEHRDSAGHRGVIRSGDAQWMTAGRGLEHEENAQKGVIAHTLQLWVNLPSAQKMTAPRYQDLVGADMPVRREPGVEIRVFSGQSAGVTSPTLNHTPVIMIDARIEPGASFLQSLPASDNAFVHVLSGVARVGATGDIVRANQLAWLSRSDETEASELVLAAGDAPVRLLLFSGRPLREPVVFGGPFVMNTQSEIGQAFADYHAGRFGSVEPA